MEQGVPEVEVVTISIDSPQSEESIDSLQSQEALTPQQKLEMLLQSIECQQDNWSFQQIEPKVQISTGSNKHNGKPSIYPIGRLSSVFIRKIHFYSSDRDDSN
jgi:hypothetical protein